MFSSWQPPIFASCLPVVWTAWNSYTNCGQMRVTKKKTKTASTHVLKLDFIAINDYFWVNWHSWGDKMFKTAELGVVGATQHHCCLLIGPNGFTPLFRSSSMEIADHGLKLFYLLYKSGSWVFSPNSGQLNSSELCSNFSLTFRSWKWWRHTHI